MSNYSNDAVDDATAIVEAFKNKPPHELVTWRDEITDAEGWLVIDTKFLDAAGGGIRMQKGLQKETVFELAKDMSLKFTLLEPSIGGAKAGIAYDNRASDKHGVLTRFLSHIKPYLMHGYGTAEI